MRQSLWIVCGSLLLAGSAPAADPGEKSNAEPLFHGLRTVVYGAPDIEATRDWYSQALGIEPYFDEPFYVGFNIGGYELALDPDAPIANPQAPGVIAYWGVDDVEAQVQRLVKLGAKPFQPVQEVGGDIKVAVVLDPFGNALGLIFNPHFKITDE